MKTTINNTEYEIKATQTMTCPAGTAYWRISLCLVGEPGAVYSQSTQAIYGEPDLHRFELVARAILTSRTNPPDRGGGNLWKAGKICCFGDLLCYGETKEDALAYLAKLVGATHYNAHTGSNQAAYLYHPDLGTLCVTYLTALTDRATAV